VEQVTAGVIRRFLERLGEQLEQPGAFYLLGGGALCLLGSPRETLDVDYMIDVDPNLGKPLQDLIDKLADEMQLDLEAVPLPEFIPLPPGAEGRKLHIAHYGQLEVYIFDLYSVALSKIARGFEADLEDVYFLLDEGFVRIEDLERLFEVIIPKVAEKDIDPQEFRAYFEEVKRRWGKRTA